jgi:hypothetical protein
MGAWGEINVSHLELDVLGIQASESLVVLGVDVGVDGISALLR